MIEGFNWAAERDAMRAPAYFRLAVAKSDALTLRGLSIDERVADVLARRAAMAARLAGVVVPLRAVARAERLKPGPRLENVPRAGRRGFKAAA